MFGFIPGWGTCFDISTPWLQASEDLVDAASAAAPQECPGAKWPEHLKSHGMSWNVVESRGMSANFPDSVARPAGHAEPEALRQLALPIPQRCQPQISSSFRLNPEEVLKVTHVSIVHRCEEKHMS